MESNRRTMEMDCRWKANTMQMECRWKANTMQMDNANGM